MAAGAIPVIVVDHYTLPYSEILDWENFSIRVPEHRMMEVCFARCAKQSEVQRSPKWLGYAQPPVVHQRPKPMHRAPRTVLRQLGLEQLLAARTVR